MFGIRPVQAIQQPPFDCHNLWVAVVDNVGMQDATPALVAEVTVLFASAVAGARKVGHVGIVGHAEEREDGRSAKGRGGLPAAVYAVAVVEFEGGGSRGREGDGAASTAAVHVVGRESWLVTEAAMELDEDEIRQNFQLGVVLVHRPHCEVSMAWVGNAG